MRNRYNDEGYRADDERDDRYDFGERGDRDRWAQDDRGFRGYGGTATGMWDRARDRREGRDRAMNLDTNADWNRDRDFRSVGGATAAGGYRGVMERSYGGGMGSREIDQEWMRDDRASDRDDDRNRDRRLDHGEDRGESRWGRGTNQMYGYGSSSFQGRQGGPSSRMYPGTQERQGMGGYGQGSQWSGYGRDRENRFGFDEQQRTDNQRFGAPDMARGRHVGRGPKGYKRSDERIREDVIDRIVENGLDASEVEISVKDGEVTLTGLVHQRIYKHRMEDIAEQVSGVKDVHNQIRVKRLDEATENREAAVLAPPDKDGRRNAGSSSVGRS